MVGAVPPRSPGCRPTSSNIGAAGADFAVAIQAVPVGMAIALGVSLPVSPLVSPLHPGGRVTQERVELDGGPAISPDPA